MENRKTGAEQSRRRRMRFRSGGQFVAIATVSAIAALLWTPAATLASEMVTEPPLGFGLLSIPILIAINAFFVAAEFAMVSVRRSQIDRLVESGDTQARTVQILKRDIDMLLSSTQLGITLSSLALGWTSEQTMAKLIVWPIRQLPFEVGREPVLAHAIAVPIAFFIVAYLQIVLGELCPKSLALLYPEKLARFFGPPSLAIARGSRPFLWTIEQSTRFLLRVCGVRASTLTAYNHVTSEELQQIISKDGEVTGLEADEREWLSNIFEFGDVTVSEVMTPRTQICAIDSSATIADVLEEVAATCHSYYPAIGESLDDVRGIVCMKDLAEPLAANDRRDLSIANWISPVRFVPEYTHLSELIPILQRSPNALVMVVDEFGGTAGLVTLQDTIEEIFGDSLAPDPSEEPNLELIDERTFSVRAQLHVEEVNDLLDLELPESEEYQTLAGLLIFYMQKIPEIGETFRLQNLEISVRSADGPRLNRLYIRQIDPDPILTPQALPIPDSENVDEGTEAEPFSPELIAELTDGVLDRDDLRGESNGSAGVQVNGILKNSNGRGRGSDDVGDGLADVAAIDDSLEETPFVWDDGDTVNGDRRD